MGVPSFFRWLVDKYANIVSQAEEEVPKEVQGTEVPVDATKPNPNGVEYDNLYLDLNGIIHPCCHPESGEAPATEEEMIKSIFKYVSRIFNIARPRKVLYLAIDGPAPRAKMNQQRSRRFKAAKDAKKAKQIEAELRKELEDKGETPPPPKSHWDSNVITPGTEFMDKVARGLRFYVHKKMNEDPAWQKIKIIISDASVPGEGEHKIVEFIRSQRLEAGYDPNTRHVIHGLDADLIMLALATHEPHFAILREQIFQGGRPGLQNLKEAGRSEYEYQPYQFLHIHMLREHLSKELFVPDLPFPFDFERVVDDFVFMCFFVGNDFLPHLPTLDIREGAIDLLIDMYKSLLPEMGGYMTNNGDVNLQRAQILLVQVGKIEDTLFKKRMEKEEFHASKKRRREQYEQESSTPTNAPEYKPEFIKLGTSKEETNAANKQAALALKQMLLSVAQPAEEGPKEITVADDTAVVPPADIPQDVVHDVSVPAAKRRRLSYDGVDRTLVPPVPETTTTITTTIVAPAAEPLDAQQFLAKLKEKLKLAAIVDTTTHPDDVRLGEDGWKDRYYSAKFKFPYDSQSEQCKHVVRSYIEGLCWVMKYYYQGCASWSWYYPYHYAPFSSDLFNIDKLTIQFEMGAPFKPFDQLMSVFPPASAHALPKPYQLLMLEQDSSIADFYPENFQVDLNGKKMEWLGVVLLPFIDPNRLVQATSALFDALTPEEQRRNTIGKNVLFVHQSNMLSMAMVEVYMSEDKTSQTELNFAEFGISGNVAYYSDHVPPSGDIKSFLDDEVVQDNTVISAIYDLPPYKPHVPRLLPGIKLPDKPMPHTVNVRPQGRHSYGNNAGKFLTPFMKGTVYQSQPVYDDKPRFDNRDQHHHRSSYEQRENHYRPRHSNSSYRDNDNYGSRRSDDNRHSRNNNYEQRRSSPPSRSHHQHQSQYQDRRSSSSSSSHHSRRDNNKYHNNNYNAAPQNAAYHAAPPPATSSYPAYNPYASQPQQQQQQQQGYYPAYPPQQAPQHYGQGYPQYNPYAAPNPYAQQQQQAPPSAYAQPPPHYAQQQQHPAPYNQYAPSYPPHSQQQQPHDSNKQQQHHHRYK